MIGEMFLAWNLLVQVHVQRCQEGVCGPHPNIPERARVVRTLESETACLELQIQLQERFRTYQPTPPPPSTSRHHLAATTTFACLPEQETKPQPPRKGKAL
jgi:hypothetical protein